MSKIDCLDHGYVRLVECMGSDLSVVRNARNSHDAAWRAGENEGSDKRLINYLMKNGHSTPFEAVTFTFEVKAPIFVFRQWHRHRTWTYNEVSARYTELPAEFYIPSLNQIGEQSARNKQGRVGDNRTQSENQAIQVVMSHACDDAFVAYRDLLSRGVPRELARIVLPLATYSRMFATVNLWNLLKFIGLRDHDHAQHEIRVYARALFTLAYGACPHSLDAWCNTMGRQTGGEAQATVVSGGDDQADLLRNRQERGSSQEKGEGFRPSTKKD